MTLVSVLSIRLSVEPEDKALKEFCERIGYKVQRTSFLGGSFVALLPHRFLAFPSPSEASVRLVAVSEAGCLSQYCSGIGEMKFGD